MEIIEVVYFKSNKESNLYLRCLWSRIRANFGKLAWNLIPYVDTESSFISLGRMDIGINCTIEVDIIYPWCI